MTNNLQYTEMDYTPTETARKVAKAMGCSFTLAASCVSARGGDFKRACEAVRENRGSFLGRAWMRSRDRQ